jgi:hypothetical protein
MYFLHELSFDGEQVLHAAGWGHFLIEILIAIIPRSLRQPRHSNDNGNGQFRTSMVYP